MDTPNYIKSLVTPTAKRPNGRKAWSIDLEQVWLPFFTATNTMGDTAIPAAAIGCPLRLGYDKTGSVRFGQSGRPVIKVAKEIAENVRLVRDNFTANLLSYAGSVIKERGEGYKAQIEASRKAGEPIFQYDKLQLDMAIKAKVKAEAEAIAQAEAIAKREAEAVKREAEVKPNGKQKVLVTA